MPYPRAIITMAQNLISITAQDLDIHESRFYMFWNSILSFHFPVTLGYGVAITGTGTGPEFLLVKVAREDESIVVVVGLKKPSEDTTAGRQTVVRELAAYIKQRFDETQFSTIYAIGGIGLSFTVYKMDKSDPLESQLIIDWTSNVTAAGSFDMMNLLASIIDKMTGIRRD